MEKKESQLQNGNKMIFLMRIANAISEKAQFLWFENFRTPVVVWYDSNFGKYRETQKKQ